MEGVIAALSGTAKFFCFKKENQESARDSRRKAGRKQFCLSAGETERFMKLVLAIVNNDDSSAVSSGLTKDGFSATKLATTGGFLLAGNTTFLIGVEAEKIDRVIEIIAKHSRRRTQMVPTASSYDMGMYSSLPVEVSVGGATVFVLDVEQFKKL